ncbi:MAG: helix-turn-helix domain-containing protein [Burkholderiaceae bacterium]|nr:helix-turn-helix domain-containing protein [Burkholderiaceae bacterium]MCD8565390.1 helix-turn-helix domain-containing protein [Burkholderiaceae bacterium]
MKNFEELKQEWLKDPEFKQAYQNLQPEYELASMLIAARARAKLTQAEVAARMGTTQSVVARLEGGRSLPSLKSFYKYASAVGAKPSIKLVTA